MYKGSENSSTGKAKGLVERAPSSLTWLCTSHHKAPWQQLEGNPGPVWWGGLGRSASGPFEKSIPQGRCGGVTLGDVPGDSDVCLGASDAEGPGSEWGPKDNLEALSPLLGSQMKQDCARESCFPSRWCWFSRK